MAAKRYCPMCDEWVKGRECPLCGADTDACDESVMADLLAKKPELGAVDTRLQQQPVSLVDRAREDGIGVQRIDAVGQWALGEWAARVALGYETKDGRHERKR